MKKKKYNTTDLTKMFDKKYITVIKRFDSKYARERWGVECEKNRDGSIDRFVREENLYLWEEDKSHVGRPVFRDNFSNT